MIRCDAGRSTTWTGRATLLGRLEAERLLTVRGDMAFDASLDYKELLEAQHMTLTVMQALLPPAVQQLNPICLNRLHQQIPSIGSGAQLLTDDAHTDFVLTASSFLAALADEIAPAQARSIARELITYTVRYEVDLAVKLELGMLGRIRAFEVIGLDYPRGSADDQEIAEVIPLRPRR